MGRLKGTALGSRLRRILQSRLFLVGTLCLGILIFVYPVLSDQYYRQIHKAYNKSYDNEVKKIDRSLREKIVEQAGIYNEGLIQGGIFDKERMDYVRASYGNGKLPSFFKKKRIIARVVIPKIEVDLPVFYGTDQDILERGCGMMPNTSLPVGGESTHTVLTAHRGLPQTRYFRDLGELVTGDIFFVDFLDKRRAYQVDSIKVVTPDDASALSVEEGKDYVTLLTCEPYMINSHRLLVRGHAVPYDETVQKQVKSEQEAMRLRLFLIRYQEYLIGIGLFILLSIILFAAERLRKWNRQRRPKGKGRALRNKKSPAQKNRRYTRKIRRRKRHGTR